MRRRHAMHEDGGPSRGVRRPNTQPDILQFVPTRATASGGTASALLYRIRECAGRRERNFIVPLYLLVPHFRSTNRNHA
jgi:hypothetical protein